MIPAFAEFLIGRPLISEIPFEPDIIIAYLAADFTNGFIIVDERAVDVRNTGRAFASLFIQDEDRRIHTADRINRVSGTVGRGNDCLGGTVDLKNMIHAQIAFEFYAVIGRGAVAVGFAEFVARMFGKSLLHSFTAAVFAFQSVDNIMQRLADIV